MRATLRITWLLLSLSFIFHGVCSDDVQNVTIAVNNTAPVTPVPTIVSTVSNNAATVDTAGTVTKVNATTKNETTQIPITTGPAASVTTQGNTALSAAAVTTPTPATPPVTDIQITPTPQTTGSVTTVVKAPLPAATTDSNTDTLQTPTASVPSNTDGTNSTVRTSANNASVGKTMIPVPTDAPTVQQSTAHTTSTPLNTNQVSQRGTEKTTVTATSRGQATAEPAGNKGTTSNPSTLTTENLHAAQTSGTTASTMTMQTTSNSSSASTTAMTTTTTTTAAHQKTFVYTLNSANKTEEKDLVKLCQRLMINLQDGDCSLLWRHQNDKIHFDSVVINGKVKTNVVSQYYEEITKSNKPTDNKTLIAILASCGALLIMIVILALCASHHRKPYNENQQHLTEEMHTVENGYHDNPTLEVMEVQPEMQEKKMVLNGEFNDSWIVPMDNVKEDAPEEEDTHL